MNHSEKDFDNENSEKASDVKILRKLLIENSKNTFDRKFFNRKLCFRQNFSFKILNELLMEIFRKRLIENSKIVSDGFNKKKKYQKMLRELLKDFSISKKKKKKTFNVLHYCIGTKCLEIEMR